MAERAVPVVSLTEDGGETNGTFRSSLSHEEEQTERDVKQSTTFRFYKARSVHLYLSILGFGS